MTLSSHGHRAGFTLVELGIVVAILGVLVSIVVPRLTGRMGTTRLKVESRTIAGVLQHARYRAMAKGLRHRVNFDLDEGRVWMAVEDNPGEAPGEYTELSESLARPHEIGRDVKIARVWTPRGLSTEGTAYAEAAPGGRIERSRVYISSANGRQTYTVLTMEAVGRVKVLAYELEEEER